jgi:metal-responsive CopG/Arc/MetJ family transcriptional regulator
MKKTSQTETKRVQVEMPQRSLDRLDSLKTRTEAVSRAEVLRRALQLFEALVDEIDKGNEVIIKDAGGGSVTFRPIF